MISRIKQKPKQIFSWYNRDSIETNKGKEASAMGRHSKTVIEYRSYEFPPHFPLRSLLVRNGAFPMYLPAYCISTTAWKSAFVKVTVGK